MNFELFRTKIRTIELNIRFIRNNCTQHGYYIGFANTQARQRFISELEEIIDNAQDLIKILQQTDGE